VASEERRERPADEPASGCDVLTSGHSQFLQGVANPAHHAPMLARAAA
jgi:hypothetical protein